MIKISIIKYGLEILEAKFRVTYWYWGDEILSPITSRVTKVSQDMTKKEIEESYFVIEVVHCLLSWSFLTSSC